MSEVMRAPNREWLRQRRSTVLAGVCSAIGNAVGIRPVWVRAFFLLSGLLFGCAMGVSLFSDLDSRFELCALAASASGVFLYVIVWFAVDSDEPELRNMLHEVASAQVRGNPSLQPTVGGVGALVPSTDRALVRLVASSGIVGLSAGVLVFLLASVSEVFEVQAQASAVGVGLAAMGVSLGLLPLSTVEDARILGRLSTIPVSLRAALSGSVALLLAGSLIVVYAVFGARATASTALVAAVSLLMLSIVLVPWGRRLWASVREESDQRARERQQAETAAYLHDSVLQTLTVIQRESLDISAARALARRQEVALRRWLYGSGRPDAQTPLDSDVPTTINDAVELMCADVESLHGATIDVVSVGQCDALGAAEPLLQATREAVSNAVRHGGAGVQVFVDASARPVEIYVRDRGPGFDIADIPAQRLGVRESIIGRMRRAGGSAHISRAIGGGTEVRLTLDLERHV